jgi:predicted ATPase
MALPISINVQKYKSIDRDCIIPFKNKTTIVIGQNNSGKSNILRCIASIFNKDYGLGDKNQQFKVNIRNSNKFENFSILNKVSDAELNDIELIFSDSRWTWENIPQSLKAYSENDISPERFGGFSASDEIIREIYRDLISEVELHFRGSIYVPNVRYITPPKIEPKAFSNSQISGETISYGNIIQDLTQFTRPETKSRTESREKLRKVQDFMAFCLDKRNVKLEVPHDQSTIHIDIDGEEHPIFDLGTGIEQLLIIGMSSFSFPKKIVLIDEPELHFHPTLQKRMMQYLNKNIEANFVLATHSAAILDAVEADILQVTHDGKKSSVKTVSNNRNRYGAVRDLGYSPSDLLLTRYVIWVEGPSDRLYLNHWIKTKEPELKEGIDYTILFYGGKILSHHSFEEVEDELVKAFSLCREFALLMDSDINENRPAINATKQRIELEIEDQDGFCWITDGREIENYIPHSIIQSVDTKFGAKSPTTKQDQVITEKKTDFAKASIKLLDEIPLDKYEWPYDLEEKIDELIKRIKSAK